MAEMDSDGKIPTTPAKLLIPVPEERKLEQAATRQDEAPIVVPEIRDSDTISRTQTLPQLTSDGDPVLERDLRESSVLTKRMMGRISQRYEKGSPDWLKEIDPKQTKRDESPEDGPARESTLFKDRLEAVARHGTARTLIDIYAFHKGPHMRWMTASLASDHQRLLVQRTVSKDLRHIGAVLEAKLEAIKLNTAAPDIRKMSATDILRSVSLTQLATQITESASRLIKNNLGPVLARMVSKDTQSKAREYVDGTADVGADIRSGTDAVRRVINTGRRFRDDPKGMTEALRETVGDAVSTVTDPVIQAFDRTDPRYDVRTLLSRRSRDRQVMDPSGLIDPAAARTSLLEDGLVDQFNRPLIATKPPTSLIDRLGLDTVQPPFQGPDVEDTSLLLDPYGQPIDPEISNERRLHATNQKVLNVLSRLGKTGSDLVSKSMDLTDHLPKRRPESPVVERDVDIELVDRFNRPLSDPKSFGDIESRFGRETIRKLIDEVIETYQTSRTDAEDWIIRHQDKLSSLVPGQDEISDLITRGTEAGGRLKDFISEMKIPDILDRTSLKRQEPMDEGTSSLMDAAGTIRSRDFPARDDESLDTLKRREAREIQGDTEDVPVLSGDADPETSFRDAFQAYAEEDHRLSREMISLLTEVRDKEFVLSTGETVQGGKRGPGIFGSALSAAGNLGRGYLNLAGSVYKGGFGLAGQALGLLNPLKSRKEPFTDIFLKDQVTLGNPLVSKRQLEQGLVFADGTPVGDVASIQSVVLDPQTRNVLISEEDLEHGLVDSFNTPLEKSGLTASFAGRTLNLAAQALGVAGRGAFGFGRGVGSIYALPFKLGSAALMGAGRMLFGRGGRGRRYRDVYRKGEIRIGHPLLSKKQLENGVVFSDGKPVKHVEDIDRPVLDRWTGDVLISEEDLETGLVDVFGEPLSRGGQSLAGKLMGTGVGLFGKATGAVLDIYKGLYGLGIDAASLGLQGIGGLAKRIFGASGPGIGMSTREDLEDIIGVRLDRIHDTLKEDPAGTPKRRLFGSDDMDQDGDDDGSYWDRPGRTTNAILEDILDELESINKRLTGRQPLGKDEASKGLLGMLGAALKGGKGLLAALGIGGGGLGLGLASRKKGFSFRPTIDTADDLRANRGAGTQADEGLGKRRSKLKSPDDILQEIRDGRPIHDPDVRASLLDDVVDQKAIQEIAEETGTSEGIVRRAMTTVKRRLVDPSGEGQIGSAARSAAIRTSDAARSAAAWSHAVVQEIADTVPDTRAAQALERLKTRTVLSEDPTSPGAVDPETPAERALRRLKTRVGQAMDPTVLGGVLPETRAERALRHLAMQTGLSEDPTQPSSVIDPEIRDPLLDNTINDRAARQAGTQSDDTLRRRMIRTLGRAARQASFSDVTEGGGETARRKRLTDGIGRVLSFDEITRGGGETARRARTWISALNPATFADVTSGGGDSVERLRSWTQALRQANFADVTRGGGETAINRAERAMARLATRAGLSADPTRPGGIGEIAPDFPNTLADPIRFDETGRILPDDGMTVVDDLGRPLQMGQMADIGDAPVPTLGPDLEDAPTALQRLLRPQTSMSFTDITRGGGETAVNKAQQALARLRLRGRNLDFGNIGDFGTPFRHRATVSTFVPESMTFGSAPVDDPPVLLDPHGRPISLETPRDISVSPSSSPGPEHVDTLRPTDMIKRALRPMGFDDITQGGGDGAVSRAQRALNRLRRQGRNFGFGNVGEFGVPFRHRATVTPFTPDLLTGGVLDDAPVPLLDEFGRVVTSEVPGTPGLPSATGSTPIVETLNTVDPRHAIKDLLERGSRGTQTMNQKVLNALSRLGKTGRALGAGNIYDSVIQNVPVAQLLDSTVSNVKMAPSAIQDLGETVIDSSSRVVQSQMSVVENVVSDVADPVVETINTVDPRYALQDLLERGSRGARTMNQKTMQALSRLGMSGRNFNFGNILDVPTTHIPVAQLMDPTTRLTPPVDDAASPGLVDQFNRPLTPEPPSASRVIRDIPGANTIADVFTTSNMPLDVQTSIRAALGRIPDVGSEAAGFVSRLGQTSLDGYGPRVLAQRAGETARLFTDSFMNNVFAGSVPDAMIPPRNIPGPGLAPIEVPTTASTVRPGSPILPEFMETTAIRSGTLSPVRYRLDNVMSQAPNMVEALRMKTVIAASGRPNQSIGATLVSAANETSMTVKGSPLSRAKGRLARLAAPAFGALDFATLVLEVFLMMRTHEQFHRDDRPFFVKERMKAYGIEAGEIYKTPWYLFGTRGQSVILDIVLAFETLALEKGTLTGQDIRDFVDAHADLLYYEMKKTRTRDPARHGRKQAAIEMKEKWDTLPVFKEYLVRWLGERVWPVFKGYLNLFETHKDFIVKNSRNGESDPFTELSHNYLVWGLDPDPGIAEYGKVQAFVNLHSRSGVSDWLETTEITSFLNEGRSGRPSVGPGGVSDTYKDQMVAKIARLIESEPYQTYRQDFMTFEAISESFILASEDALATSSSWTNHDVADLKLSREAWDIYLTEMQSGQDQEVGFRSMQDWISFTSFETETVSDMSGYADTSRLPPNAMGGGPDMTEDPPKASFFSRLFGGWRIKDDPPARDVPKVVPMQRRKTTQGGSASLTGAGGATLIPASFSGSGASLIQASFGGADPTSYLSGPDHEADLDIDLENLGPVPQLDPAGKIGTISSKYESRGDSSAVGYDSTGGLSYGKYQIATRTGTLREFLKFCDADGSEAGQIVARAMRQSPGKATWKMLAKKGLVQDLEYRFIKSSHYDALLNRLRKSHPDLVSRIESNKALQEMAWSTAVQHGAGGAASIFRKEWGDGKRPLDQFVTGVYKLRGTKFPSSTARVRAAVHRRFQDESRQVLALLNARETAPSEEPEVTPRADDLYAGLGDPDIGAGETVPTTSEMGGDGSGHARGDFGGEAMAQAGQGPGSEGIIATASTSVAGGDPAVMGGGDPAVETVASADEPSSSDPQVAEMQMAHAVIDYDRMGEVFKSALTDVMTARGDPEVIAAIQGMEKTIADGLGEGGAIAMKTQALVDKPVPEASQNVTTVAGGFQRQPKTGLNLAHETVS